MLGGGGGRMAAPDELPRVQHALPEPRHPIDDRPVPGGPAWFAYTAAGDQIGRAAALRAMSGQPPHQTEVSRTVLARSVHRDDHAKALGAITQTWTSRELVHTTLRLMRADGGWFDVDCSLEPVKSPDGT